METKFKEKEHYQTQNGFTVYVITIHANMIHARVFYKNGNIGHESFFLDGTPVVLSPEHKLVPKE
jgi:hypothetical protein